MTRYEINIAKQSTAAGWDGKPKFRFYMRVRMDESQSEAAAKREFEHLSKAYPWPSYSLSLSEVEEVTRGRCIATTEEE